MNKGTLVKSSDIKAITGWTRYQMRKARALGWVKMVRDKGQIYYIRESLKNPREHEQHS